MYHVFFYLTNVFLALFSQFTNDVKQVIIDAWQKMPPSFVDKNVSERYRCKECEVRQKGCLDNLTTPETKKVFATTMPLE